MREITVKLEDVGKYGMCKALVLGWVRTRGVKEMTIQEIAKDFGRSPMCIYRHLRIMEERGLIHLRRGQWMRGNPIIGATIVGEDPEE